MSQLTQSTREDVFEEKGEACYFCEKAREQHKEERGRDLDIHHILPSSKGGSDEVENLIPVCIKCHRRLESTQGDALSRVADRQIEGRLTPLRERNRQLKRELKEEREKNLPVDNINAETIAKRISKRGEFFSLDFESVGKTHGSRIGVYSNPETAREAYEEWGSVLRKERLTIPNELMGEIIAEVLDELEELVAEYE